MASSSSPWPPPARRLPLANRSNLSSASPSPSPAPRSSKLPPPPLPSTAPANKENTHPFLLPPSSPSDSTHFDAAAHTSSLRPPSAPFRDVRLPSPHLHAHRDGAAAVPVEGTPARPLNAANVEPSFSTPLCTSTENSLPSNGGLRHYSRRNSAGAANVTMSCPPLDRTRIVRDTGYRPGHWPLKRDYDFPNGGVEQASQGKSKKSKNRSRRRSLPEPPSKHWLPESFVAVQRSYFAEVDAFELSEEYAGSEAE